MFKSFGVWEIVLILVIVIIFFGVGKLPQVGSALGKGMRAFRRGQSGDDAGEDAEAELPEPTVAKTARVRKAAK